MVGDREYLKLIDPKPFAAETERLENAANRSGSPRTRRRADLAGARERAVYSNNRYVLTRRGEKAAQKAGKH